MFKKFILRPIIRFLFTSWGKYYSYCPYNNNESKYMAKGVKPLSTFADDKRFLDEYVIPEFKLLLQAGVVKEHRIEEKMKNFRGEDIILLKLNYYYPDEEWRVHRWIRTWKNLDNYIKTIDARHGLLLGYPKKYIRRYLFMQKLRKWFNKKQLF